MDKKCILIEQELMAKLGAKKLPKHDLVICSNVNERFAFNKKVSNKYIITISETDGRLNFSGFKHEIIHLTLKRFSFVALKVGLPVPNKYSRDNKRVKFEEYLVSCLEIRLGEHSNIEKNLDNYEKKGFTKIKQFYKIFLKIFKLGQLSQTAINKLIKEINSI